jgi:uncharacterized cupredoxin-like copper-binding protein
MTPAGEPGAALLADAISRRAAVTALIGAAALALAGPARAAEPLLVELVMTEYRFAPDRLLLPLGRPCRLLLENRGAELHEFTAPEFLAAIALDSPEVLAPGGREVVVRPGERKALRFTARRPGRYPMACADHDWAGMVGEIVVA